MYPTANGRYVRVWIAGFGLLVLLNLWGVARWHYDDGLQDSSENLDTRVILQRLQQPHSVWAWFVGDWVLGNGFYRPLPSALYQVDYWLWGGDLLRWKWTNGLLATAAALALVGFLHTLTGRRSVAFVGGLAFTLWQTGFAPSVPLWVGFGALAAGTVWGYRWGDWRRGAVWGAVAFALVVEWGFLDRLPDIHTQSFAYRAMGWIPGRTATLLTLFALLALWGVAGYARTRRTHWAVLGVGGFIGAMLSYEQFFALPLLMALTVWATGVPRALAIRAWGVCLACVLLLAPYAIFYRAHIPTQTQYHQQRIKRVKTLPLMATGWLAPPALEAWTQVDLLLSAPLNLLFPRFWFAQMGLVAYLIALRYGLRLRYGWVGWLGSLLAYAPAAPLLPLMHYYYLPAALRALWWGILFACLPTLRPTRRATSVAMGDAMYPRRLSPPSTS
ncbi:MAG: hypothetical protein ACUVR1_05610 [Fimbriimonadales bacterium]